MAYSPFTRPLLDINGEELATLKGVAEGWYVEYKSALPAARRLAKTLSSFANQYGGWLFLGVSEETPSNVAAAFPGIAAEHVPTALEAVRNASKDLLRPEVYFEHRVFDGPIESIGLAAGRSVIAIHVPQGPEPPYIHADGRVYRRVGDSSDPLPSTDPSALDRLWERGRRARGRLRDFVGHQPIVSKAEENVPYVHLTLTSDPYGISGRTFRGSFFDFVGVMQQDPIPFDNCYSHARGFVARQTTKNDPYLRLFTWQFFFEGHSRITLPLNLIDSNDTAVEAYDFWPSFTRIVGDSVSRILDLNIVFEALATIATRHRDLAKFSGMHGPFYFGITTENVWRCIAFLDLEIYMQHLEAHGLPVIQENAFAIPALDHVEALQVLPEVDPGESQSVADGVALAIPLLEAFGIPREIFQKERATAGLAGTAERYRAAQECRTNDPRSWGRYRSLGRDE